MINKALLLILDGWGIGDGGDHDAITLAKPEYWQYLKNNYPYCELHAKEESVGLPKGCLSGSEVGHLTIGAGRVMWQQMAKIDRAVNDNTIISNPALTRTSNHLKKTQGKLHLAGMLSDGGIHSHYSHLLALINWAKEKDFKEVCLHIFLDGRDMAPMSAKSLWEEKIKSYLGVNITLTTFCGRATAMDRSEKWERTLEIGNLLTKTGGLEKRSPEEFLANQYENKVTDEFIPPTQFTDRVIEEGDAVIFFNFRADRMRQLVRLFLSKAPHIVQEKINVPENLFLVSLAEYDAEFTAVKAMFPPEIPANTLGEWISKQKLKQFRIAETEKYAHVTYFMNGGREKVFAGEERLVIPSLGLTNYASNPEMSLPEITASLMRAIATENYSLVICNIANGDMVGHSGDLDAGIKAVQAVDAALKRIVPIAIEHGYACFITSDHGNIEKMKEKGEPHTAHTFNNVPFIITDKKISLSEKGELNQIAPTILKVMGLDKPKEMTSEALF